VFLPFHTEALKKCWQLSFISLIIVLCVSLITTYFDPNLSLLTTTFCHAQSLAATNRVMEQLNWLTVESFFMSCSISWMASLTDNWWCLRTKKGLQGGKTIQQRSEFFASHQ
jgi:hypothetical protein